jgi:hypothetical protein
VLHEPASCRVKNELMSPPARVMTRDADLCRIKEISMGNRMRLGRGGWLTLRGWAWWAEEKG